MRSGRQRGLGSGGAPLQACLLGRRQLSGMPEGMNTPTDSTLLCVTTVHGTPVLRHSPSWHSAVLVAGVACLPPLTATALPPLPGRCSAVLRGRHFNPHGCWEWTDSSKVADGLHGTGCSVKELLVHALLPAAVAPVTLPALLQRAQRELGKREGGCSLSRPCSSCTVQRMHAQMQRMRRMRQQRGAVAPPPNTTCGASSRCPTTAPPKQ